MSDKPYTFWRNVTEIPPTTEEEFSTHGLEAMRAMYESLRLGPDEPDPPIPPPEFYEWCKRDAEALIAFEDKVRQAAHVAATNPLPWEAPPPTHFGPTDPLPVDPVTDWMLDEMDKMRRADTPPEEWYSLTWTAAAELPPDDCFKPERFIGEEALCALFTAKNLREEAAKRVG